MRTTIGEGQNKQLGWKKRGREMERGGRASTGVHDHLRQQGEGKRTGAKETKKREEKNRIQKKQI